MTKEQVFPFLSSSLVIGRPLGDKAAQLAHGSIICTNLSFFTVPKKFKMKNMQLNYDCYLSFPPFIFIILLALSSYKYFPLSEKLLVAITTKM